MMNEEKKSSTGPETKVAEKPLTPPVEAPKVEEVADATETPTMRAIRAWVSKRVHSSPLSRTTEAYNYLLKRLPELASLKNGIESCRERGVQAEEIAGVDV